MKLSVLKTIPLFLLALNLQASKLDYTYAIKWAHEGKMDKALSELEKLHTQNPQNLGLLYDYISVLGWAKQDAKALKLAQPLDINTMPSYVLKDIAKSARNEKRYIDAAKLYQKGIKRYPQDPLFYQGMALSLHDMKKPKLAMRVLNLAEKKLPGNTDILAAKAEMYELHKHNFDAMRIYQKLADNPATKNKYIKKFVHALQRLGMPFVAEKYIQQNPSLFTIDDKVAIQHDQSAFELRWGKGGFVSKKGSDKLVVQKALDKLEKNIQTLKSADKATIKNRSFLHLNFDKIVALNTLGKRKEAIALFESLQKQKIAFPAYVLTSVGDAYLYLKKPYLAQSVLKESLEKNKHNFETKYLLFYAYSDAYQMQRALRYAQKLNKNEPKRAGSHKVDTEILEILAYEYSNYLDYAQHQLEKLLKQAPANSSVRNELAHLYYLRGWNEKARSAYQVELQFNPQNYDALQGIVMTDIAQKHYQEASATMHTMQKLFPTRQEALTLLQKKIDNSKKGYFTLDSTYGSDPSESGSNTKTNSYEINARYYAPLIQNHYRPFVYTNIGHTKFYENRLTNKRVGAGLNYTNSHLDAAIGLGSNLTALKEMTGFANARYSFDDYWSLFGNFEYFSSQTPLRAIMYGIRADRLQASVEYRSSESRQSSFSIENMDFNDGNSRFNLILTHYEKLITGAYYNLDATLYLSNMYNSKDNSVVYYNPKEDLYASLNLSNIWNIYNWYDTNIKQIAAVEIGTHWEKHYGSNLVGNLNIAQEVELNKDMALSYGFLRKRSAYDGNLEYGNAFYLNAKGRF